MLTREYSYSVYTIDQEWCLCIVIIMCVIECVYVHL